MGHKKELRELQSGLVQLQQWVIRENKKVVILFEGRDSSSKGSTIKRIVERLNPNHYRVVAKGKPTPKEEKQKYFTRWRRELPRKGELVIFDRSWHTRAGVESVMGFASPSEVDKYFKDVKKFEKKLTDDETIVIKVWLSITQRTQERRFKARLKEEHKRWKLSPMDLASRTRWNEYTQAKERMFSESNFKFAPWVIVNANNKKKCRLDVIDYILDTVPYEYKEICPSHLPPVKINKPSTQPDSIEKVGFEEEVEEWKDIKGYEGRYKVSSLGRIGSDYYLGKRRDTTYILKPLPNKAKYTYYQVNLTGGDGKSKMHLIHNLVADAFLDGRRGRQVNHIDEDTSNNRVSNLEYMTHQENVEYTCAKYYNLTSPDGEVISIYNLNKFCRENNLSDSNIHKVLSGEREHHKGWTKKDSHEPYTS